MHGSWEENRKAVILQLQALNSKVDILDSKLDNLVLSITILETKYKVMGVIYGLIGGAVISSIVSFIMAKVLG